MFKQNNWKNELDEDNNEVLKDYQDKIEAEIMVKPGYHHFKNEGFPTQTHGLVTTVPQNLAFSKLGDKHAPTRNSLRHSRMIVMNKVDRVPIDFLPPIVRYHDRAKAVMWIILIIGIIMCFESSSLKIYAANSKPQLNPFYAAVPILFSGIFGFVHLRCCRKEYPGLRRNGCEKFIKVFSITTSLVASLTALMYFSNIFINLLSFFYLDCAPPDILTDTCDCKFIEGQNSTSIFNNSWDYIDLSCFELYYVFNAIIGFTAIICLVIVGLQIYYLSLHITGKSSGKPLRNYNFIE